MFPGESKLSLEQVQLQLDNNQSGGEGEGSKAKIRKQESDAENFIIPKLSAYDSIRTTKSNHPKILEKVFGSIPEFYYTWSDLCCQVSIRKWKGCCHFRKSVEIRHILKNVNGYVKSGQLVALMGSSGAGKTTLLNVLNFRRGPGAGRIKVTGDCHINGTKVVDPALMSAISAYVYQDDLFVPRLKVLEHLTFCSKLKMPANTKKKERRDRVVQIMKELGLWDIRNSYIGDNKEVRGISGGERRRLAVATEMLSEPRILFLDEPISGLDSYMARNMVRMLKKTAAMGKAIVCTIHAPSSEVFHMFDHLCLLTEGRVAYAGPTEEALKFFEGLGYKCPTTYNPADYYIKTLAIQPERIDECLQKSIAIASAYQGTSQCADIMTITKVITTTEGKGDNPNDLLLKRTGRYQANWYGQFMAISLRTAQVTLREPATSWDRLLQNFCLTVVIGSMYWNQKLDISGISSINSLLVTTLFFFTFLIAFPVIYTLSGEMTLFYREHWNGMYSASSYYMAKSMVELPIICVIPIMIGPIIFFMANLPGGITVMLWQAVILVFITLLVSSISYLSSAVTTTINGAIVLLIGVVSVSFLFTGYFIEESSARLPGINFVNKYSWGFYAVENMFIAQWEPIKNITQDPQLKSNLTDQIKSGDQVLSLFHYKKKHWNRNFLGLSLYILILRLASFIAFVFKAHRR